MPHLDKTKRNARARERYALMTPEQIALMREKAAERTRRYYLRHPKRVAESSNRWYWENGGKEHSSLRYSINSNKYQIEARMRNYNLTAEQVNDLLAQGCNICGTFDHLCIDHDHNTGRVRGCLCKRHNLLITAFDARPEEFETMLKYVRKEVL